MMKRVLLTGFDAFNNEKINPSIMAVNELNIKNFPALEFKKVELPTIFKVASAKLIQVLQEFDPQLIICVGQGGGRSCISLERVAINIDDATIKDNQGNCPVDQEIVIDGPAAYFSNLPLKKIIKALNEENIPGEISNTAGTYVCNHVMYTALHYLYQKNRGIKGGFVHIPFLPQQVLAKPKIPAMSLFDIVRALNIIIKTSVSSA